MNKNKNLIIALMIMVGVVLVYYMRGHTLDEYMRILLILLAILYSFYKEQHMHYFFYHFREVVTEFFFGFVAALFLAGLFAYINRPAVHYHYHGYIHIYRQIILEIYCILGGTLTLFTISLAVFFLAFISFLPPHEPNLTAFNDGSKE